MTWQPIETAPKDATGVLLHWESPHCEPEVSDVNTVVGAWWGLEGWVCYMDMVRDPRCPFEPTHWMPLPTPPKGEE